MYAPRRLTYPAGIVTLVLVLAGCSSDYRALGTITYASGADREVTVSNPSVNGCHSLGADGAKAVRNATTSDMVVYLRDDCRKSAGEDTVYIARESADSAVESEGLWHSFTFVGR